MSNTPFGFGRPGDDGDDENPNPTPAGFGQGGDMQQFADMLRQFADMPRAR
jgi:hypothetical protein